MRHWVRLVGMATLTAYASWAFAADLAGIVHGEEGRPQEGVEVILKGANTENEHFTRQTKTTNAGKFVFAKVPPGTYRLQCSDNRESEPFQVRVGMNRKNCP